MENGRRLPLWMMGASSASQIENPDNTKLNKKQSDKELSPIAKKTRRQKESSLVEEDTFSKESSQALVKRKETKRRKRMVNTEEDSDSDTNTCRQVVLKKCNGTWRKHPESAADKRLKKMRNYENKKELEIQAVRSEDIDLELTVEDLVTIAKEYVTDDKNMEQENVSKRIGEQRIKSTKISLGTESIDHNEAKICNETMNTHDVRSSSDQRQITNGTNTSASVASKSSSMEDIIRSTRTDDPARDMLHLFLGPLLKKPVDEKKSDIMSKDMMTISLEHGLQNKTDVDREETAPLLTKKKSSLRDKIAMFLD